MKALRVVAATLAAAVMLAGCAGQPEIPYDRAAKAQIKKIGIVTPVFAEPSVILLNSVGSSFGLIGALADSSMQSNRDAKFKTLLRKAGARTYEAISDASGKILAHYPSDECAAYLKNAGYA